MSTIDGYNFGRAIVDAGLLPTLRGPGVLPTLLAIASHLPHAHPGTLRLAKMTGLSVRSVKRARAKLKNLGILIVSGSDERRTLNYRINLQSVGRGTDLTPPVSVMSPGTDLSPVSIVSPTGDNSDTSTGDISVTPPGTDLSPKVFKVSIQESHQEKSGANAPQPAPSSQVGSPTAPPTQTRDRNTGSREAEESLAKTNLKAAAGKKPRSRKPKVTDEERRARCATDATMVEWLKPPMYVRPDWNESAPQWSINEWVANIVCMTATMLYEQGRPIPDPSAMWGKLCRRVRQVYLDPFPDRRYAAWIISIAFQERADIRRRLGNVAPSVEYDSWFFHPLVVREARAITDQDIAENGYEIGGAA